MTGALDPKGLLHSGPPSSVEAWRPKPSRRKAPGAEPLLGRVQDEMRMGSVRGAQTHQRLRRRSHQRLRAVAMRRQQTSQECWRTSPQSQGTEACFTAAVVDMPTRLRQQPQWKPSIPSLSSPQAQLRRIEVYKKNLLKNL